MNLVSSIARSRPVHHSKSALEPRVGDRVVAELSIDDLVVERSTYRLCDETQPGEAPQLVMDLVAVETLAPGAERVWVDVSDARAASAFAVKRHKWTLVKDGHAVTKHASSAVLAQGDDDACCYTSGHSFRSATYRYTLRSQANDQICCAVSWRVQGIHGASHPTRGGSYVASIYVQLVDSYAAPNVGVDALVSLENVANIGSDADPNPRFDVEVQIATRGLWTIRDGFATRVHGATGLA